MESAWGCGGGGDEPAPETCPAAKGLGPDRPRPTHHVPHVGPKRVDEIQGVGVPSRLSLHPAFNFLLLEPFDLSGRNAVTVYFSVLYLIYLFFIEWIRRDTGS